MDEEMKLSDSWELETARAHLIDAVRGALCRPGIDGKTLMHLGGLLCLAERLPARDENFGASLQLHHDSEDGGASWEAAFTCEGLEFTETTIFHGASGSYHETRVYLMVTADDCGADEDIDEWMSNFVRMAGDSGYGFSVWCEPLPE